MNDALVGLADALFSSPSLIAGLALGFLIGLVRGRSRQLAALTLAGLAPFLIYVSLAIVDDAIRRTNACRGSAS
jgi:hypothetical protein